MTTWNQLDLSEYLRAECLMALAGRTPITTTYSGVGTVAWDDCCGQLVVTPERVYRCDEFPAESSTDERCSDGTIAVELLVSLTRCVPTPDDRGRAPDPTALQAAHALILEEAMLIWQAVTAPLPAEYELERAFPRQAAVGSLGGCVTIETRVTLGVEAEAWC